MNRNQGSAWSLIFLAALGGCSSWERQIKLKDYEPAKVPFAVADVSEILGTIVAVPKDGGHPTVVVAGTRGSIVGIDGTDVVDFSFKESTQSGVKFVVEPLRLNNRSPNVGIEAAVKLGPS